MSTTTTAQTFTIAPDALPLLMRATDQDRASVTLSHICFRTDPDTLVVSMLATDGKVLLVEDIGTATDYHPDACLSREAFAAIMGKGRKPLKDSLVRVCLESGTVTHTRKGDTYSAPLTSAVRYPNIPTRYLEDTDTVLPRLSVIAKAAQHCVGSAGSRTVMVIPGNGVDFSGACMGRMYADSGQVEAILYAHWIPAVPLAFNADYCALLADWCKGGCAAFLNNSNRCLVSRNGNRKGLVMLVTIPNDQTTIPQPSPAIFHA